MSSAEFTYWAAFFNLEPWGTEAEDWRAALVATVTANAGGGKKDGKPFEVRDFMPRRKKQRAPGLIDQRKRLEAFLDGKRRDR